MLQPSRTKYRKQHKGNVEYWVAVVKPGKVIFEIAGVPEELAQSAFRLAGFKLPIKTKFIKREAI